jgi:hypothetical protein
MAQIFIIWKKSCIQSSLILKGPISVIKIQEMNCFKFQNRTLMSFDFELVLARLLS